MNEIRTPRTIALRHALSELGFRPAILDCATMTIHPQSDGPAAATTGMTIEGFERRGFFYTHASAERAAREWM